MRDMTVPNPNPVQCEICVGLGERHKEERHALHRDRDPGEQFGMVRMDARGGADRAPGIRIECAGLGSGSHLVAQCAITRVHRCRTHWRRSGVDDYP